MKMDILGPIHKYQPHWTELKFGLIALWLNWYKQLEEKMFLVLKCSYASKVTKRREPSFKLSEGCQDNTFHIFLSDKNPNFSFP